MYHLVPFYKEPKELMWHHLEEITCYQEKKLLVQDSQLLIKLSGKFIFQWWISVCFLVLTGKIWGEKK